MSKKKKYPDRWVKTWVTVYLYKPIKISRWKNCDTFRWKGTTGRSVQYKFMKRYPEADIAVISNYEDER